MELLQTLAVVIGVILVLALATQSLQEILKGIWPVKAQARLALTRGLLEESTLAAGLHADDARALSREIVGRFRGLGLKGVRPGTVRVDDVDADQLVALVERINPSLIPGLHAIGTTEGHDKQEAKRLEIAANVRAWYPVAMSGVKARTTRRMRAFSLATSFAVVLTLNVDAISLWTRVDADAEVRQKLLSSVTEVQKHVDALEPAQPKKGEDPPQADEASLAEKQKELDAEVRRVLGSGVLTQPGDRQWKNANWWLGIAVTTLLVSLGMPFWHETLGALLGLRKRIEPEPRTQETQPSEGGNSKP